MGKIEIKLTGSFDQHLEGVFSAESKGHAAAVVETIEWLALVVWPSASKQDHRLQAEGCFPVDGFGLREKVDG